MSLDFRVSRAFPLAHKGCRSLRDITTVFSALFPTATPTAAWAVTFPAKRSLSLPRRPAPPGVSCIVARGIRRGLWEQGDRKPGREGDTASRPEYPEEPALRLPQPHPPFAIAKSLHSRAIQAVGGGPKAPCGERKSKTQHERSISDLRLFYKSVSQAVCWLQLAQSECQWGEFGGGIAIVCSSSLG